MIMEYLQFDGAHPMAPACASRWAWRSIRQLRVSVGLIYRVRSCFFIRLSFNVVAWRAVEHPHFDNREQIFQRALCAPATPHSICMPKPNVVCTHGEARHKMQTRHRQIAVPQVGIMFAVVLCYFEMAEIRLSRNRVQYQHRIDDCCWKCFPAKC